MFHHKSHRIISLIMAFLMLCSSTGFSIDFHFCQGNLKHFNIFGKAESCHSKAKNSHCKGNKKTCHASLETVKEVNECQKDCCSNKTIKVPTINDLQLNTSPKYKLSPLQFAKAFVEIFILNRIALSKNIVQHQNYIPPLLSKDIPILIQSFLL